MAERRDWRALVALVRLGGLAGPEVHRVDPGLGDDRDPGDRRAGRYAGINWIAMGALVIGIAPNVPGFLKSAHVFEGPENFFDQIYVYAWFLGFFIAMGLYLLGMKLFPRAGVTAPGSGPAAPVV